MVTTFLFFLSMFEINVIRNFSLPYTLQIDDTPIDYIDYHWSQSEYFTLATF